MASSKQSLKFEIRDGILSVTVPSIGVHDLLVIEWITNSETTRELSLVNNDRPNMIGDPFLSTSRPRSQLITKYFNPAAFQQNGQLTFGNAGRNILVGPGFADMDSGLMKNFSLTERHKLQFRAEFFNLFNRPNFANPVGTLWGRSTLPRTAVAFSLA